MSSSLHRAGIILLLPLTLIYPHARLLSADPASTPPAASVDFKVDVMSILSKAGCNMGTCHGNLNGKGGFKLSLRGQDPNFDYQSLVAAARGRRVNLAAPEQSLIIQKASGAVPHRGGLRFKPDSQECRELITWIRQGAVGPVDESPQVVKLTVTPEEVILNAPADSVHFCVTAHFSDGTQRDVTRRACYELSNLKATVDQHGLVRREEFGETTLIVRYLDQQRPIPIAFTNAAPDFEWRSPQPSNFVDRYVYTKLRKLSLQPSARCSDFVFVRRAYLDLVGRLPSAEAARAFVFDARTDKRRRLVDTLLNDPGFADFWALKLCDILRVEEKVLDPQGVEIFHAWIRDKIQQDVPIDEFVRELVTGTGSTFEQPAANYYRANRDPATRSETTARLFLGTRLQCAKCHNHPFDRWTQDDYYRWANVFSQMDYEIGENKRKDRLDKNEFAGEQTVLAAKQDEVRNPTTNQIAAPKFLGGPSCDTSEASERLHSLAEWLTAPDNVLFVQSQVNFVWYQLMGKGLVDPIDDFRLTNPASNPELLEALANHFVDSGFSLRRLVRTIMLSQTYQASSEPNPSNIEDETSFSHPLVRRLPAEVLLDIQSDFLGAPAEFVGYPVGLRAVQIPGVQRVRPRDKAPKPGDRFLKTFGKPPRIMACDCERSNETNLKQVLGLLGSGLNERIEKSPKLQELAADGHSDSSVIEEIYWSALSRPPSNPEYRAALALLRNDSIPRLEAVQDLAWVVMNAKEFVFRR